MYLNLYIVLLFYFLWKLYVSYLVVLWSSCYVVHRCCTIIFITIKNLDVLTKSWKWCIVYMITNAIARDSINIGDVLSWKIQNIASTCSTNKKYSKSPHSVQDCPKKSLHCVKLHCARLLLFNRIFWIF